MSGAATKLRFRVERTEYAEIEVDVAEAIREWGAADREADEPDEDYIIDVLWEIGVKDLMWSGDFIEVLDKGADENIEAVSPPREGVA